MWRDLRLPALLGIEHPLLLAPMAGPGSVELAVAVSNAGGLGSLPCAMLSPDQAHRDLAAIRASTNKPFNANFFCHMPPPPSEAAEQGWKSRLAHYFTELGLDPHAPVTAATRQPFGEEMCCVVEDIRPHVVSFHFGLPEPRYIDRLRAIGTLILSSATTVDEAKWLEARGVDAIIAQGLEAGGHRGMFLSDDPATQIGTFALVPQIADAVSVPVIAAGGIMDGRGFAAALVLGAAGVQMGTAYLATPEARTSPLHRAALAGDASRATAVTNVMTGRPARGMVNRVMRDLGPMSPDAPPFPLAATPLAPLRATAEAQGRADFTPLWAGQAAPLAQPARAAVLTDRLVAECRAILGAA